MTLVHRSTYDKYHVKVDTEFDLKSTRFINIIVHYCKSYNVTFTAIDINAAHISAESMQSSKYAAKVSTNQ